MVPIRRLPQLLSALPYGHCLYQFISSTSINIGYRIMMGNIGRRYSISLQSYILLVSSSLCIITSTFAQVSVNIPATVEQCWYPCKDDPNKNIPIPGTNCKLFYVCRNGEVTNSLSCESGMSFDKISGQCLNNLVTCVDPTCEPTLSPSVEPTISPSNSPSKSPTGKRYKYMCVLYLILQHSQLNIT